MAIFRTTKEAVEEYYNSSRLNQSQLKVLITEGIQAFLDKRDELKNDKTEKLHFIIGNAVDYYLSYGAEAFAEAYHISEMRRKPPSVEMTIIKMVMEKVTKNMVTDGESPDTYKRLSTYPEQIYEALNEVETIGSDGKPKIGYYMNRKKENWKDDNRFNGSMQSTKSGLAEEYWQELITARGKQILSDAEAEVIMGKFGEDGDLIRRGIILNFIQHENTAFLFEDKEGVDTIFQLPLYFEEEGEECKALPDMMRIMHRNRLIIPLDNKTMGFHILKFNEQANIRRYDLQGSFYTNAIDKSRDQIGQLIGKDISDYEIANFSFLVNSTINWDVPLIFILQPELLRVGELGDGRYKSGWRQGLALYKDWKSFNFSVEERFANTKGKIKIELDYKYNEIF